MSDQEGWEVVVNKKKERRKSGSPNVGPLQTNISQGVSHLPHQDWDQIVVRKRKPRQTELVMAGPGGRAGGDLARHEAKLDQDTNPSEPPKVRRSLSIKIQNYRRQHNLTQAELAQKLHLKTEVVSAYEKGTAYHDGRITSKFNRFING